MTHEPESVDSTGTIARTVAKVRRKRGLTGAQLAERMTEVGVKWDRSIVANLENGRRRFVTVDELLALAYVLDVAPVHLLVPPLPSPTWDAESQGREPLPPERENSPNDWTTLYKVTKGVEVPLYRVREFIRGQTPLPGMDRRGFYSELPPQEFTFHMGPGTFTWHLGPETPGPRGEAES